MHFSCRIRLDIPFRIRYNKTIESGSTQEKEGTVLRIYALGWHWEHTADFEKLRPDGIHGMQIILVQSKARIGMGDKLYQVEPNTAFVVESCFPHSLYADGEPYTDDWIRFDLENDDIQFLNELGITFNVPIPLASDTVSRLIAVCETVFRTDQAEKDAALRHLLSAIFMQIKSDFAPQETKSRTHYDIEIERIRKQIYSQPAANWNIEQIAEKLNLSVSHFQRLYKQRFGIPCSKDILTSRMEYAKQLLATTDLSAIEVAEKCGYTDYSHFSRVFQKYACEPPSKYRKNKQ